ncbi:MAG: hypothetical protein D9C04_07185 [Nitrosopumilus sp. B06]|nr:MAG: hypothetical protein EB828_06525 [Nitrosopumilus sp. D6]RNJ78477.1 MAG: hypothetical protein D9C04_07185 [Nitrosopumilus sp. B06]
MDSVTLDRRFNGNVDASYAGKWIILIDGKIVASDIELENIIDDVRKKYPGEIPYVRKVLESGDFLLQAYPVDYLHA